MIESFRKYTGLMIVVLVLLFIGLVFLDGGSMSRAFGGTPVMEVDGEPITKKEYDRNAALAALSQSLPTHPLPPDTRIIASKYLGDSVNEASFLTAGTIPQLAQSNPGILDRMALFLQGGDPGRFIANRLAVQKAGLEYGVTPGDEEVESFVENVLFADPEGNYDQEAYAEFLKTGVSRIGGNRGFNEYIRDLITAQNLAKLIGGGLAPEMETLRLAYDTDKQVISGKQVTLESAPLEGTAKPTPEELQAYFKENGDNYKSDELRKVSYVLFEPDWDATLKTALEERAVAQKKRKEEKEKAKEKEAQKAKAEEVASKANEALDQEKKDGENPDAPKEDPKGSEESKPAETSKPDEATEPEGDANTPKPEGTTSEDSPDGSEGDPGEPGEAAPSSAPETTTENKVEPEKTTPAKPSPVGSSGGLDDLLKDKGPEIPSINPKPILPTTPAKPKTPREQLTPSERNKAVQAIIPKVTEFYDDVTEAYGKDIEGIAKKYSLVVKTSDFFSKEDAPELFSASLQNDQRHSTVADLIFTLPTSGALDTKLSETMQTEYGWIIAWVDDVTDAQPLPFDKVRARVSIDLKKKMAKEELAKQAKETHEKLAAAIKEGKTFEEAATELKLKVTNLNEVAGGQVFNMGGIQRRLPSPPAFIAAKLTDPGQIAPLKLTPDEEAPEKALIVFVEKREVLKDADYSEKLDTDFKNKAFEMKFVVFQNWLNERYLENNVVAPNIQE